jgi:hypothetical protein
MTKLSVDTEELALIIQEARNTLSDVERLYGRGAGYLWATNRSSFSVSSAYQQSTSGLMRMINTLQTTRQVLEDLDRDNAKPSSSGMMGALKSLGTELKHFTEPVVEAARKVRSVVEGIWGRLAGEPDEALLEKMKTNAVSFGQAATTTEMLQSNVLGVQIRNQLKRQNEELHQFLQGMGGVYRWGGDAAVNRQMSTLRQKDPLLYGKYEAFAGYASLYTEQRREETEQKEKKSHWYDPFTKSAESFKEIGSDIWQGFIDRNNKKFDSFYDFSNYLLMGLPEGLIVEPMKMNQRNYDEIEGWTDVYSITNWLTMGIPDMVIGAFNPEEPFSKEHWMDSAGVAGALFGMKWSKIETPGSTLKPDLPSSSKKVGVVEEIESFSDSTNEFRQISSGGLRNELPLSEMQKSDILQYLGKLGFPEDQIIFSSPNFYDDWNTGMMYDRLIINTDVLPANSKITPIKLAANSKISANGTLAHEIIGHYESYLAGKSFDLADLSDDKFRFNYALDEAQASIRAARFAPDLTNSERMMLLRDAITRLRNANLKLREVRDLLYIDIR